MENICIKQLERFESLRSKTKFSKTFIFDDNSIIIVLHLSNAFYIWKVQLFICISIIIDGMTKDPICGMFVEENENSIHHAKDRIRYYFCVTPSLNEFLEPEKE